jgi:predicted NAD-dependent protein-ADP-ribosyltransferase YbiA (DUF1768 family)
MMPEEILGFRGVCNGVGKNMLGRMLMFVREIIRKENGITI